MASYTSNLKSWGATGQEYPDGYSYLEGEQPVDAWDNFLTSEVVSDINDHLVPLTNSRVESDKGAAGGEPTSPDASHLYYDEDNERLEHYDSDVDDWHGLMKVDGDTMTGALDMGGYNISNAGAIQSNGNVRIEGTNPPQFIANSTDITNDRRTFSVEKEGVEQWTWMHDVSGDDSFTLADSTDGYSDVLKASLGGNVDVPNGTLSTGEAFGNAVYATESDVPALGKGEMVYVDGQNALYVEDGS